MINTLRRRSIFAALLLFLLLALLFMHRALLPPVGQALAGHDIRSLFYYWLDLARTAVFSGHLPLWDAATFAGYPFLSNPQVGLFYPPAWLAILLPVRIGISWYVVFHLVVAGLGMFCFVRFVSQSRTGALLAGLAFAFSGFAAARIWAGHIGLLATDSWLPWMLLALAWSVRRRSAGAGLVAGLPWGLAILAGHTTSLIYLGLAWGLWALYLAWNADEWRLVLRQFGLAVVVGLLLSSVQTVALVQFSLESSRAAAPTYEFATAFSLPPAHLLTLLIPDFFGEPTRAGYWSVPSFDELTYYVGVLPLLGLALALKRPSRLTGFYLSLIVLGLLLALGSYGFLYRIFYDWLPPFRLARAPGRAAYLFVLAAPALLGEAVAQWERRDSAELGRFWRWLLGGTAVAGVAALAATGAVFAAQHPSETSGRLWHQVGGWGLFLLLALAGGGLLWRYLATADGRSRRWLVGALAVVLVADLWIFGAKLVNVGSIAVHPMWPEAKAIIGESEARVLPWGVPIFEQNGAAQVGLRSVFGYNALEVGANIAFASSVTDPRSTAYDILGAGAVVATAPLDQYLDGERPLTLLGSTDNVWVYRRSRILPLARLVTGVEIIPDVTQATARVHDPDFDPTITAILPAAPDCDLPQTAATGTARIEAADDGFWRIRTDAETSALLILSETAYPGWRVTIDGEPASWQTAYTAVRSVCVPAGEHVVEWTYRPRIYVFGGAVAALTLLLVAFAAWRLRKLSHQT